MACDVCLAGVDDIDNAFYSECEIKARKPHVCGECREPIQPGTVYYRAAGKSNDDGRMFDFKTCALCYEISGVFHCNGGIGWYLGTLWEEMQEQAFPELTTASPCFTELSPVAKSFVMERWRAWKRL